MQGMQLSEDFRRQRRNLILAAGALILVRGGGVSVNDVTLGIGRLHFERPEAILVALWALVLYFFIRYLQFAFVDDAASSIRAMYRKRRDHYLTERMTVESGPEDKWEYMKTFFFGPKRTAKQGDVVRQTAWVRMIAGEQIEPVPLNSHELRRWEIASDGARALVFTLLWHPAGTEVVLPPILGIGAICFAATGNWPGSITSVWAMFTRS